MRAITLPSNSHRRDFPMTDEPGNGSPNELVAVHFRWPRHVRKAIRQGALDKETTDSAYVLYALRHTYGIEIDDEMLGDRRGKARKDRPGAAGKD